MVSPCVHSASKHASELTFPSQAQARISAGLPYTLARVHAGLTQAQAAALINSHRTWWSKCEGYRKRYNIRELSVLRRMSGLTWEQWGAIIDEACKPLESQPIDW